MCDNMTQQTITRNWTAYNLSQTSEKLLALRIISDAVDFLGLNYAYKGNGRPFTSPRLSQRAGCLTEDRAAQVQDLSELS